mmetsp:Transcript_81415/g.226765  ORF Transcript_81415/g.226765 Transcript_81415/m.226765 type:complete len:274 (-) Transcript_81415:350-1171(-)
MLWSRPGSLRCTRHGGCSTLPDVGLPGERLCVRFLIIFVRRWLSSSSTEPLPGHAQCIAVFSALANVLSPGLASPSSVDCSGASTGVLELTARLFGADKPRNVCGPMLNSARERKRSLRMLREYSKDPKPLSASASSETGPQSESQMELTRTSGSSEPCACRGSVGTFPFELCAATRRHKTLLWSPLPTVPATLQRSTRNSPVVPRWRARRACGLFVAMLGEFKFQTTLLRSLMLLSLPRKPTDGVIEVLGVETVLVILPHSSVTMPPMAHSF